jgi:anti-sigma regulatory factor (Ser/Thr protein kinase)
MRAITRLHVPSEIKYTKLVEDFMYSLGGYLYPDDERSRNNLSAVINEVFTNIVKHSNTPSHEELVRFQMEVDAGLLIVSIYDHGPGISIAGQLPPYGQSLIGLKKKFRKVIDGTVYMNVIDPYTLSFYFKDAETEAGEDPDTLSDLGGHGFGLSIVTRIMDSVTYTCIGDDIYDWKITKKL